MRTLIARLLGRRGNAMVELALVLPALTGAVVFVADVGTAVYRNMTLKSAVHAGADYAVRYGDLAGIRATIAAAANRDPESLDINTLQFCGCATTVVTCGGVCPDGTSQQVYMRVSVAEFYSPMFLNEAMAGTMLGGGRTLEAQATFRVK